MMSRLMLTRRSTESDKHRSKDRSKGNEKIGIMEIKEEKDPKKK